MFIAGNLPACFLVVLLCGKRLAQFVNGNGARAHSLSQLEPFRLTIRDEVLIDLFLGENNSTELFVIKPIILSNAVVVQAPRVLATLLTSGSAAAAAAPPGGGGGGGGARSPCASA